MELSLFLCQTPFSLPLLCDVHHHRDGAATRGPTAANAKPSPVRGMVLKTPARWIAQALDAFSDQSLDIALAIVTIHGQVAQESGVRASRLKQISRRVVDLFETVIAENDIEISIRVDKCAWHVAQCYPELGFRLRQVLFSLLLIGDVSHHRNGATARGTATDDAIPPTIRRMVLKAPVGWVPQTVDARSHQGLDVALPVVAVIGEIAQKIRIGAARLKQLLWHPVHLLEAIIAGDDIEIFIGIDQRTGHIIERHLELD